MALVIRIVLVVFMIGVIHSKPLAQLFEDLLKKQTEIKNQQLLSFISKSVPYGIEPPNPRIAEYETFKSDKSSNFLNDGHGNLVFRQFRRLRLSDVLKKRGRNGI